ncbi:MAG: hypothetical protein FJ297_05700 [Planctomycetes bacterium]|nr:hypothetical protein [Planctomycetota bacterium]
MRRHLELALRSRFLFVLGLVLACRGCGDGRAKQRILDEARNSVEKSLELWKRGEKPAAAMAGPQPIEFFDEDWNRATKLVDYSVRHTYLENDGTPRCAVDLFLKSGDRPTEQVRATYEMANKEGRLVISRDPMS